MSAVKPPSPSPSNPLVRRLETAETGETRLSGWLLERDKEVLEHLGAALVMKWNRLPRYVQQHIFETAVAMADWQSNVDEVRRHLGVFLHKYTRHAGDTGGEG